MLILISSRSIRAAATVIFISMPMSATPYSHYLILISFRRRFIFFDEMLRHAMTLDYAAP